MRSLILTPEGGGPFLIAGSLPASAGRGGGNDLDIDDSSVSENHAIFFSACSRLFVIDRGSKNGTRIGNEKLTPGRLFEVEGGSRISFGEAVYTAELSDTELDGGTRTRFESMIEGGPVPAPESAGPFLLFLNTAEAGRCEPVEINSSGGFSIGRGGLSDLIIDDPAASSTHCELTQLRGRIALRDIASKNGTLLNGALIGGTALLSDRDIVTVGNTLLMLVDPGPVTATPFVSPASGGSLTSPSGIGWIYAGLMAAGTAFSAAMLYAVLR